MELLSLENVANATGGALGGSAAMSLFFPLDVIRTHAQLRTRSKRSAANDKEANATDASKSAAAGVDAATPFQKDATQKRSVLALVRSLIKDEGIGVLYRGLLPVLGALFASNFVYFYSYNALKLLIQRLLKRGNEPIGTVANLAVASTAGVVNVLTTCPLWVASTRLKVRMRKKEPKGESSATEKKVEANSLIGMVMQIGRTEGIAALWGGCVASLWLVSNPTVHFVVYERMKFMYLKAKAKRTRVPVASVALSSMDVFFVASLAKLVATIVTYPLQVAQSILRATKKTANAEDASTVVTLRKLYEADGFFGWYRGIQVKIVQTVAMTAFQFVCFEKVRAFVREVLFGFPSEPS